MSGELSRVHVKTSLSNDACNGGEGNHVDVDRCARFLWSGLIRLWVYKNVLHKIVLRIFNTVYFEE